MAKKIEPGKVYVTESEKKYYFVEKILNSSYLGEPYIQCIELGDPESKSQKLFIASDYWHEVKDGESH